MDDDDRLMFAYGRAADLRSIRKEISAQRREQSILYNLNNGIFPILPIDNTTSEDENHRVRRNYLVNSTTPEKKENSWLTRWQNEQIKSKMEKLDEDESRINDLIRDHETSTRYRRDRD